MYSLILIYAYPKHHQDVEHYCHPRKFLHTQCLVLTSPTTRFRDNLFSIFIPNILFSHSVMSNSCDPVDYSMPDLPVHHQLLEFTQTHVHSVGDTIQPSHPLSSPSPPALNLSSIRVFSNESVLCIRWPKYWSFNFSISPSNEYSGLISFKMDWLDLLAVQGTLKSLLQHHSSKTSIQKKKKNQKHQFFSAQLSLKSNSHIRM